MFADEKLEIEDESCTERLELLLKFMLFNIR